MCATIVSLSIHSRNGPALDWAGQRFVTGHLGWSARCDIDARDTSRPCRSICSRRQPKAAPNRSWPARNHDIFRLMARNAGASPWIATGVRMTCRYAILTHLINFSGTNTKAQQRVLRQIPAHMHELTHARPMNKDTLYSEGCCIVDGIGYVERPFALRA